MNCLKEPDRFVFGFYAQFIPQHRLALFKLRQGRVAVAQGVVALHDGAVGGFEPRF